MTDLTNALAGGAVGQLSYSFWQVHAKGGYIVISVGSDNGQRPFDDSHTGHLGAAYSQCILEGGLDTVDAFRLHYGNTAVRSCLLVHTTEDISGTGIDREISTGRSSAVVALLVSDDKGQPGQDTSDVSDPVWFIGTTFASDITTRGELRGPVGGVRPLRGRGNLVLAADPGAFATLTGLDQPAGMVQTGELVDLTVATVPGAGASVLGNGYEFAPRRDIAGNLRPAQAAVGAYEP
jgi:hypothetical protein